jgi:hypothetical protein
MKAISKLPRYYQNEVGLPPYQNNRIPSAISQTKKRRISNYL